MQTRNWYADDDNLILHRQENLAPALERIQRTKDMRAESNTFAEDMRPIGSVPTIVVEDWIKEAGLRMDDREAVGDLIKRKLMSGEFAKFRIDEGTF